MFENKNVLITGGTGMIGSHLVQLLSDKANGGDEDGMLFVVYSHTGRPVAMGMWAAGNESPPRSASSIANYGYTFDVGDGGYGDAAPGGTFGTDGNITLWNAYPQGSYIINRGGGTMYHSFIVVKGSGS